MCILYVLCWDCLECHCPEAIATKTAYIGGRIIYVGVLASGTTDARDDLEFLTLRNLKVVNTLTGSLKDTHNALAFAA